MHTIDKELEMTLRAMEDVAPEMGKFPTMAAYNEVFIRTIKSLQECLRAADPYTLRRVWKIWEGLGATENSH